MQEETPPTFADRFADRIHIDPTSLCHVWTGRRDRDGYGLFQEFYRSYRAHRTAWEEANGRPVPRGYVVRHACDNPSCVNPAHLTIGRQRDNVADRQRRGRQASGSRNGRSKLNEIQVAAVKRILADGVSSRARLARAIGVHPRTLHDIEHGRIWTNVEPE